ncbi:heavy-metal-associated domain-containing protein [Plastorhodobacter daqingensis]|uniref:Heavy-metal-associated domain-containing protein n=1 Tax=Plastorhodobacter daqingensis TaxID=1387281 RepID=A0ABW2UN22_9RHOB
MEFHVTGMTCGHCEAAIRTAILTHAPSATVTIDRDAGRVRVEGADDEAAVLAVIREEGYEATSDRSVK